MSLLSRFNAKSRSIKKNIRTRSLRCENLEERRLLTVVTSLADDGMPGTLRAEIAATTAPDTVTFSPGLTGTITLTMGQLVVDKDLTIDGTGATITVDGDDASRVLRIDDGTDSAFSNVVLRNFTITGGNASGAGNDGDGGGVYSNENLTLDEMTIEFNSAALDGAGVAQGSEVRPGGTLVITGGSISNNTALDDAAALDHYNSHDLSIDGTLMESNVSGDMAGGANQGGYVGAIRVIDAVTPALYAPQATTINNLTFINNEVLGVPDGDAANPQALGGILITSPYDGTYAGGAAPDGWDVTITNSTLSGNIHKELGDNPDDYLLSRGAALFITDVNSLTIENSTISDNSGTGSDGCVFCRGGAAHLSDIPTVSLSDTVWDGNYSYSQGGAMRLSVSVRSSSVTMDNVTMTNNTSKPTYQYMGTDYINPTSSGGGLWAISFDYNLDLNLGITDSTFSGNAAADGAGLEIAQGVDAVIEGTTISNNEAFFGGGLFITSPDGSARGNNVSITASTISGNLANRGGGLYGISGYYPNTITLDEVSVDSNTSYFGGGGIQVNGYYYLGNPGNRESLTVNNSTISRNVVLEGGALPVGFGGGINAVEAIVNVQQSTISQNEAYQGGGGMFGDYYSDLSISLSTITGNTANTSLGAYLGTGGGIYTYRYVANQTLDNTIVADNVDLSPAGAANDLSGGPGAVFDVSYSFIGDATSTATINDLGGSVIGGGTAMLGPLADNGGNTLTHGLLAGSPAINAGDPADMAGVGGVPEFDQRGDPFSRVLDGRIDIGAFEGSVDSLPNGDFNDDGAWDCTDINMLTAATASGMNDPAFDMNGDGVVDGIFDAMDVDNDIVAWLERAGLEDTQGVTGGNPFIVGDADLNGFNEGPDFIQWNNGKFTENTDWCGNDSMPMVGGNFNGDGFIDGQDFILWNAFKFTGSQPITQSGGGDSIRAPEFTQARMMRGNLLTEMTEPDVSRKQMLGEGNGLASADAAKKVAVAFAPPTVTETAADFTGKQQEIAAEATRAAVDLGTPATFKSGQLSEISTSQSEKDEDAQSALDKFFANLGT